jgi:hypothetical protein
LSNGTRLAHFRKRRGVRSRWRRDNERNAKKAERAGPAVIQLSRRFRSAFATAGLKP